MSQMPDGAPVVTGGGPTFVSISGKTGKMTWRGGESDHIKGFLDHIELEYDPVGNPDYNIPPRWELLVYINNPATKDGPIGLPSIELQVGAATLLYLFVEQLQAVQAEEPIWIALRTHTKGSFVDVWVGRDGAWRSVRTPSKDPAKMSAEAIYVNPLKGADRDAKYAEALALIMAHPAFRLDEGQAMPVWQYGKLIQPKGSAPAQPVQHQPQGQPAWGSAQNTPTHAAPAQPQPANGVASLPAGVVGIPLVPPQEVLTQRPFKSGVFNVPLTRWPGSWQWGIIPRDKVWGTLINRLAGLGVQPTVQQRVLLYLINGFGITKGQPPVWSEAEAMIMADLLATPQAGEIVQAAQYDVAAGNPNYQAPVANTEEYDPFADE